MAQGLATLPAVQREAVVLFELDGYSIVEIAAMQRASVSAVKSRLTRGRERLRRFYEQHGTDGQRIRAARAGRIGADPKPRLPVGPAGNANTPLAATAYGLEQEDRPDE